MMIAMKLRIKQRLLASLLTAFALIGPVLGSSGVARAGDDLVNDARMEGYKTPVVLDAGVAPYYLLLAALGFLGVVVLFKDAKRSHLD